MTGAVLRERQEETRERVEKDHRKTRRLETHIRKISGSPNNDQNDQDKIRG